MRPRAFWLLALAACGGETRRARPAAPPVAPRDAGAREAAPEAPVDAGPDRLALLAAHEPELAPGARTLASRDVDASKQHDLALPALDADECLRAAFDADARTKVTLVDARGIVLGEAEGTEGTLGASGPICLRKGDAPTFRLAGSGHVRVVVWATP